jgi:hypothetical protein
MKKRFANELAREIAFSGPILLRLKFDQYFWLPKQTQPTLGISYNYDNNRLLKGTVVILVRGPLPCGEHKTAEGSRLWFITPVGPRFQTLHSFYDDGLDSYFERI